MDYETTLKDDFFTQPANVCGMPLIYILGSRSELLIRFTSDLGSIF